LSRISCALCSWPAIPLAWATGTLSLGLLLVIVALNGTASLVNDAASMAFLPRLVPRGHLQRAHARIDEADAVAQTTGPALAGVLVKLVGAPLTVLVDAASYLFAAFVIATLPVGEAPTDAAGPLPTCGAKSAKGSPGSTDGQGLPCWPWRPTSGSPGPRSWARSSHPSR
jgi:MFS family permease